MHSLVAIIAFVQTTKSEREDGRRTPSFVIRPLPFKEGEYWKPRLGVWMDTVPFWGGQSFVCGWTQCRQQPFQRVQVLYSSPSGCNTDSSGNLRRGNFQRKILGHFERHFAPTLISDFLFGDYWRFYCLTTHVRGYYLVKPYYQHTSWRMKYFNCYWNRFLIPTKLPREYSRRA